MEIQKYILVSYLDLQILFQFSSITRNFVYEEYHLFGAQIRDILKSRFLDIDKQNFFDDGHCILS